MQGSVFKVRKFAQSISHMTLLAAETCKKVTTHSTKIGTPVRRGYQFFVLKRQRLLVQTNCFFDCIWLIVLIYLIRQNQQLLKGVHAQYASRKNFSLNWLMFGTRGFSGMGNRLAQVPSSEAIFFTCYRGTSY